MMKKVIALLMSAITALMIILPGYAAEVDVSRPENAHLSFGDDGKFTILQVADIQDDAFLSNLTKKAIRAAVEKSEPDLIVLTGDNIAGYYCGTKALARSALKQVMDLFEDIGVPVAAVFGNHDDDDTAYTKVEQIEQYETYSCYIGCAGVVCEAQSGENKTLNAGTYNVPIFESADSDKVAYNIWCIDSGNYNPDDSYGGYGYVMPEQIEWYREKSNELKEANGGNPVPSIAFQHIVPPQIYKALKETDKDTAGAVSYGGKYYTLPDGIDKNTNWMNEAPCPPNLDFEPGYAELDAMIEQKDVKAVFYGHDHINNYIVPYEGIDLVSTAGITFLSYNDRNRGFRVITLDKSNTDTYDTYYIDAEELLENGSVTDKIQLAFRNFLDSAINFFKTVWNKITHG
ncbi:MAG: metallophosphoesterase [Clostridia bacterium]|nr:metallophosphoesterase [Clostridia bacterium]